MLGKSRRSAWSLGVALVVFSGALAGTAQAAPGGPVDLGTLPGDDSSMVLAVNEAGVMVGTSSVNGDTRHDHPVRWDADGTITALPTPGGSEGEARDVNENGVAAGYVLTATIAVPARWDAQGQVTLMPVPPGYRNALSWAISDTGVVVGNWLTADNRYNGFRWDPDGSVTDLGVLPGETWAMAEAVSADGRIIVGVADRAGTQHPVRWVDGGPITELAPQSYSGGTHRINAGGVAAGVLNETPSGPPAPATWDRDGTIHRLDWPSPYSVWIYGIGPTGYVVGFGYLNPPKPSAVIWDPDGHLAVLPDGGDSVDVQAVDGEGTAVGTVGSHATVWYRSGVRVQLGTLPGAGASSASGITGSGRVVGSVTVAGRKYHAVYWTLR